MRLVDRGFEEGRGVSEPIVLSLNGVAPRFTVDVSIAPGAVMGSDVEIGPGSRVWFNATFRGVVAPIRIGSGSNVQDGAVPHVDAGSPLHRWRSSHDRSRRGPARHHGGRWRDVWPGRGGSVAIVAAGVVVVEEAEVRPGALLMGVPTREKGTLSDEERAASAENAARDVRNAVRFRDSPATE